MCDEQDVARWGRDVLSRRGFGVGALAGTAAALAACASVDTGGDDAARALHEADVSIRTAAGVMDAFFVSPAEGDYPAVILWPDIAGLRASMREMARRLAREGYAVVVLNPYYRDVAGEQFADFATFAAQDGFQKVTPWRERLDAAAIASDAQATVEWLWAQGGVDASRGIGTQGYCMGGPFTVWSAAADSRIKAAASFHGGGLVRADDSSPHRMLRKDDHYLFAIAQNDDAKEPEAKTELRAAANATGAIAEIEVYPADHGWCVPDSPKYNQSEAERAWARLLALYQASL